MYAKNAGPDPESAVTASKSRSFSTTVCPAASSMDDTSRTSAFVAFFAGQIAHIPSFARSARLGITLTRRTFAPNILRSVEIDLPATMDTTSVFDVSMGFTRAASAATSCGFTARNMAFAQAATSTASDTVFTPYRFAISLARGGYVSAITTFLRSNLPAAATACTIPSAILPAPKKPSVLFMG